MMKGTALAAGGFLMSSVLEPVHAASGNGGFKIGACDWSLGKRSDPNAFDVAKAIGLDGVQVSLGTVENDMQLRKPEIQHLYLEKSKEAGVEIASLAIGELNNVPYKSDPKAEEWVRDSIDVCGALGCKVVLLAFSPRETCRTTPKGLMSLSKGSRRSLPRPKPPGFSWASKACSARKTISLSSNVSGLPM